MKKNVALIGMPLSGKTTVGRLLAPILGMHFLDLDDYIEYETQMSVGEIFSAFGEEGFRLRESKALFEACDFDNALIACGGGTVIREANREAIKENCYTVYLRAEVQTLLSRENKNRPLLTGNKLDTLNKLISEREDFYLQSSDVAIIIDNKSPNEIVDEICNFFRSL